MSSPMRSPLEATYPAPLSRQYRLECVQSPATTNIYRRAVKKRMHRTSRYRTQPVTFDEIKEVDEETGDDDKITNSCQANERVGRACSFSCDGDRDSSSIDHTPVQLRLVAGEGAGYTELGSARLRTEDRADADAGADNNVSCELREHPGYAGGNIASTDETEVSGDDERNDLFPATSNSRRLCALLGSPTRRSI